MSTPTTPDYLILNSEKYANEPALSSKNDAGEWDTTTWSDFLDQTMGLAKALTAMGWTISSASIPIIVRNGIWPMPQQISVMEWLLVSTIHVPLTKLNGW